MKTNIPTTSTLPGKLFFAVLFFLIAFSAASQTLPANFSQVLVANGMSNPTVWPLRQMEGFSLRSKPDNFAL